MLASLAAVAGAEVDQSGDDVTIVARGTTGTELIGLSINGEMVQTWSDISTEYTSYVHEMIESVEVAELKIHFLNDGMHEGIDRNVSIDRVEVAGSIYESEDPANPSLGRFTIPEGCTEGYKQTEVLHCNGWISFAGTTGLTLRGGAGANASVIGILAAGSQGAEIMELKINGTSVATWSDVSTVMKRYRYVVEDSATIDALTVHFVNDGGLPDGDRNLFVDRVTVDGIVYESEDSTTQSSGSWTPTDGCLPGAKLTEWLHCHNAWFDYRATAGVELTGLNPDEGGPEELGDIVVVRAAGTTGAENINLTINDEVVAFWTSISTEPTDYEFAVNTITTIDDLRVEFVNDQILDGFDRNVTVDHVKVGDTIFESEADENVSIGSWVADDGCAEGAKQSEALHCNGWISFVAARGLALAPPPPPPPTVIFDTDLGPDIDDALALAMLHAYNSEGKADLAAVTVSRNSVDGARFADLVNTFYGRPDLPIGIYHGSTPLDSHDTNWSRPAANSDRYPHDVHLDAVPSATTVMRRILANAADNSVLLVQTGLSVNTADLLASGPDEISPLSGAELVAQKVKLLSIMAGHNGYAGPEFNVRNHVESATTVFRDWPTEVIQSEGSLGYGILYPLTSIENDFEYIADHPIKEAYLTTDLSWHEDQGDYYNMRTWDLHSVLAAVEPIENYYRLHERGRVDVDNEGRTVFTADPDGNLRSLGSQWDYSDDEIQAMVDRMIETVSRPPDEDPAEPSNRE